MVSVPLLPSSQIMRTKIKNKNKVLTPLLPIRGVGELPLNSPCRNVFLSTRNVERDQEDVEFVL
jgi:hypothetical protein